MAWSALTCPVGKQAVDSVLETRVSLGALDHPQGFDLTVRICQSYEKGRRADHSCLLPIHHVFADLRRVAVTVQTLLKLKSMSVPGGLVVWPGEIPNLLSL